MTECQKLNALDSAPDIISAANQKELVLSTYNRTSGTEVTLSCNTPFVLHGQDSVTCLPTGNWNVDSIPYCTEATAAEEGLTDETKILIGVLVGVSVLVIVVLVCIVCVVRSSTRSRSEKRPNSRSFHSNKGFYADEVSYAVPARANVHPSNRGDNLYRGDNHYKRNESLYRREELTPGHQNYFYRERSSSVDAPYSRSQDISGPPKAQSVTGSLTRGSRGTRGAEMFYIYKGDPDRKRKTRSEVNYREEKRSRQRSGDPRRDSNLIVEWPSRTDLRDLDEFNTRALFHGRDPFLWRPVDTNWGFHLNRPDI